MGAVDYLLKQEIDPDGLLKVLDKASAQIEQDHQASQMSSSNEVALEKYFLSLLTSGSMDKTAFFANIAKHGFPLHDEALQLILFCPEQPAIWPDLKVNHPTTELKKTIRDCFQPELTPFIFFSSEDIITLVLNTSAAHTPKIETACLQANDRIHAAGSDAYVAVLSEIYSGVEKTRKIYNQTLPIAQYRFYNHSQKLFKAVEYEGKIEAPRTDYKQLAAWLEKFDFEGLYNYIVDYISTSLKNGRYFDPYELKKMLTEVFNYLLFFLSELGFELTEVKEDRFQYIKMIETAHSLPELWQAFKKITDMAAKLRHKAGIKKYSGLVTGVMDYIKANFSDEISLTTAAAHLHVNKNYLCDLFKQQTGENFGDYLTKVRLEKAKEILKSDQLSVAAVGERVGYPNPSYFVQLFKKNLGITPLEYKNLYWK